MICTFRPALIVVDVQEDFCPPDGSLAIPHGREIVPVVEQLLECSFVYRVATKDWHPQGHVSFASSHTGKEPFSSSITIVNPNNVSESYKTQLWPDHCIQDTPGAEIISGIDLSNFDRIIAKGSAKDIEMFSGFYAPLKNPRMCDSGLAGELRRQGITHVYVVGLAADYCVKWTALDAASEGFETYIVEEATKPVDANEWERIKGNIVEKGVKVVSIDGEEVNRVRHI